MTSSQSSSKRSHLDEAAFVEQIADCLQRWISVGDVRLGDAQHVEGGLVELDKGGVVDLTQAEKLEDLLDLRGNFVDTKARKIQEGESSDHITSKSFVFVLQRSALALIPGAPTAQKNRLRGHVLTHECGSRARSSVFPECRCFQLSSLRVPSR